MVAAFARHSALAAALVAGGCGPSAGEGAATGEATGEATSVGTSSTSAGGSDEGTTAEVPLPEPHGWELSLALGTDQGAVFSVWGDGPGNVVAVGGQPQAGLILRYVDGAWVGEAPPPLTPRLSWVHGIGGKLHAVGFFGAALRHDGAAWVREESGVDAPLWGVWGARPDELWAVGGAGTTDPPVMLRGDGEGGWTPVDVAAVSGESTALYKVWGRAADDVFAIGARGLVLHYDGASWRAEASRTTATLIGISGAADGSGDVVVAGGRSSGVVLRRRGGIWEPLHLPDQPGLDGAWVDADGAATVVGRGGFIGVFPPGTRAWVPEESGVSDELHAVFGVPGGPVFAVGGRFEAAPYTGVILRRLP